MRILMVILIGLFAASCDPADLPPASIPDICKALVGPIKYNSTNKLSQRYAAYLLSLDLHQRNEIGRRIHCPAFK